MKKREANEEDDSTPESANQGNDSVPTRGDTPTSPARPGVDGHPTTRPAAGRSFMASIRSSRQSSSSASGGSGITEDQRFHRWCKEGKLPKVSDALSKGGDVDTLLKKRVGVYGYTPLHEAASYGHDEILRLLIMYGGDVDCKANSGYTPLHLAASSGRSKCVQRLLRAKADFFTQDGYGKTALQTAELGGKTDVIRILKSAEVIYAAERNADNLGVILQGLKKDDVEEKTFDNGLNVCATYGYLDSAAKFIIKGAENFDQCVGTAVKFRHYNVAALLLLCDAASRGDVSCVKCLFDKDLIPVEQPEPGPDESGPHPPSGSPLARVRDRLPRLSPRLKAKPSIVSRPRPLARHSIGMAEPHITQIRRILLDGCVKTVHVINVALRKNQKLAAQELLLNTDCNHDNGNVDWHGLAVRHIDPSWLHAVGWAQRLFLASNGLTKVPTQISQCTRLLRLDLCRNALQSIPAEVVQLPMLRNLNLSRNQLRELPECSWSTSMAILDVSANELNVLPRGIQDTTMLSLNIRNNRFVEVPEIICNLTTLHNLNISHNDKILVLPNIMGRLKNLIDLKLSGNEISDPPPEYLKNTRKCISYLRQRLRGCEPYYRMKLMVVGYAGRGKTTLIARLRGQTVGNLSTVGIELNEWHFRPNVHVPRFSFNIWDFGGQEVYYATHQCFMTKRAVYLILWNVMHGDEGIQELRTWLDNIVAKAGSSRIIIVATHKDKVTPEMEAVDYMTQMLNTVSDLTDLPQYRDLKVAITSISCADTLAGHQSVDFLKNLIYTTAEEYELRRDYKVMGEKIPASYFRLDKLVGDKRRELVVAQAPQIIRQEELKSLIEENGITDIDSEEELQYAAEFLHDVGTMLHYDERASGLHDLYFTDPCWLSDMMAKVVTVRERNPYVNGGLLLRSDVPQLFKDKRFPQELFDQYLSLLARFEIALPLDRERIMIPSMLPDAVPTVAKDLCQDIRQPELMIRRQHKVIGIPAGFWSRLISRLVHSLREFLENLDILDVDWHGIASVQDNQGPMSPTSSESPSLSAQMNADKSTVSCDPPASPESSASPGSASSSRGHLVMWRTGLYFQHPTLFFCIRPLPGSDAPNGVETLASAGPNGRYALGLIVDQINKLATEWYPGLDGQTLQGEALMEMFIPCTQCTRLGYVYPFLFTYEVCASAARLGKTIQCPKHPEQPAPLADLVPELLLLDLPEEFLLKEEDVYCPKDDDSKLGEGGFGTVYKARVGDRDVAVKTFNEQDGESSSVFKEIRQEVAILKRIYHRHLVGLVGITLQPLQLLLELAPLGALNSFLSKKGDNTRLPRMLMFNIGTQVALALSYLHSRPIIFRDLKSANVLLFSTDVECAVNVKLTDYGIAALVSPSGIKGFEGTKGFQAPEILRYGGMEEYTTKVDVYSLGIFMYEVLSRGPPFIELNEANITDAVLNEQRPKLVDVPNVYCGLPGWSGVMFQCWRESIDARPTAEEAADCLLDPLVLSTLASLPVPTTRSVRTATYIPGTGEVWLFCDDQKAIDVLIINPVTMKLVNRFSIKNLQVKGAVVVNGSTVWVAIKDGLQAGQIFIYDAKKVGKGQTRFKITGIDDCISSMTVCVTDIAVSTMDGRISLIPTSLKQYNAKQMGNTKSVNVGDFPPRAMLCIGGELWCASQWEIHIYDAETLVSKCKWTASAVEGRQIDEMKLSQDGNTVWCSVYDHWLLNAWNSHSHSKSCTIDITRALKNQVGARQVVGNNKIVITAIETCLDTLWLGLSSGEILVYDEEGSFLSWMQPYDEWVRLLLCCGTPGPCGVEEATMMCGAKGFKHPQLAMAEPMDQVLKQSKNPQNASASLSASVGMGGAVNFAPDDLSEVSGGTAVLWEAFSARHTKLMYQRSRNLKGEVTEEADHFRNITSKAHECGNSAEVNEWDPGAFRKEWMELQRRMPEQPAPSPAEETESDLASDVARRAASVGSRSRFVLDELAMAAGNGYKGVSKVFVSEALPPPAAAVDGDQRLPAETGIEQLSPEDGRNTSASVYCSDGPFSDGDMAS